jgi:hypothetical protein
LTTKPRRSKAALFLGKKALPWTCEFVFEEEIEIETKDGKRKEKVTRRGKGRTFNIPGKGDTDLFPTGVLCAILGRSRKTLYKWEKDYDFPPALYDLAEDQRRKRWYSRNQLIGIQHAYNSFGRLRGKNYDKLPMFIATVRAFFVSVDYPARKRESDERI